MDIQGYMLPPTTSTTTTTTTTNTTNNNDYTTHKYSEPEQHNLTSSPELEPKSTSGPISPIPQQQTPTVAVVKEYPTPVQEPMPSTSSSFELQQQQQVNMKEEEEVEEEELDEMEEDEPLIHPSFWAHRFDKRKSSPAILGLPFGLNHETQLSLHLSQQRNSIEAAMLLANFNRLLSFPKPTENEQKGQWQDDMSIPCQKNKNVWDDDTLSNEADTTRRHSYDVNMSWNTMPESFLDRPDLINKSYIKTKPPPVKQEIIYTHVPTRVTWSHDDTTVQQTTIKYPIQQQHTYHAEYTHNHPSLPPHPHHQQQPRMYHPTMSSPLVPHTYHHPQHQQQQQQQRFHTLSTVHENQPGAPMLHPLARAPEVGQKREHQDQAMYSQRYYPYGYPPQDHHQHGMPPPPPPPPSASSSSSAHAQLNGNNHPIQFYYPSGKLPLPATNTTNANVSYDPNTPIMGKPKRKKQKSSEDGGEEEMVESNEANYPDMSSRDVEAARTDPEARPRKQKLRFVGDKYTPQWVRYNGQSKEGLCDTCKPGKWLQLKNSAYWYHKQFFHGISSVSGKEFVQPLETRWVDQDLVEGLCHQCRQWVAVSNVKRKNSVLWYRHAHKCHVYHKPKQNVHKN